MNEFIELIKYLILGIVQGFTEILPISSSGHLVLFQHILNLKQPGLVFEMFTNTASFLALFIFFSKDIIHLIKQTWSFVIKGDKEAKNDFFYVLKLIVAIIPIGIVGLLIKDHLDGFKTPLFVGLALLLTGSFLFYIYKNRNENNLNEEITFKNALVIGLIQVAAVFPGISRSGSTIIGGLFQKVSLKSLLKFSFLCYIIISVPTSLLSAIELSNATFEINILGYGLAFLSTFVATYFAAYLLMKKIEVRHLKYFAIYCFTIGLVAISSHLFF
ncbi:Undecaprenyl-diphosphatase (Bacitracin resistance protein) [Paracholeplasma brassicae]|jgi:undecaprenyl-diphosphatase|uniref:Undecaprenyl-diphosphatase n=1 Tax=Acholeplasma brassicae TaxID=61635 RepID=U4KNE2_9MOLU|nr:undecaprenyl-diphosphate phosphatase [Paracholeplasma brassicae]CCV65852.1 Undecaprenyl-diphosphatase (Bacitracin resistance protein) [Paracholeplasma brassicae]